jgi:large subunit ribosomal protein L6
MSRIGKQPVTVPGGVTVTVSKDNVVTVKGPKGELKQSIDRDITVEVKDGQVVFTRPTDQIRHRALHGLYRSIVSNLVKGVTDGYQKKLELATSQEKGQNPIITLDGIDKQLIGQVAAKLRGLRKPEPYKGKGVRYVGEVVRKKAGKAAGK